MASSRHENLVLVLKELVAKAIALREQYLEPEDQQEYQHLSVLARDSSRKGGGAVSASKRPFLDRANQNGVSVWLEALDQSSRGNG